MDKKGLMFKGKNQTEIFADFVDSIEQENLYEAVINFNRLDFVLPEAQLYLASFYAKLGDIAKEVDILLKVLTLKNFNRYNAKSLLYRINLFFSFYNEFDVFEHYKKLVLERFNNDETIKSYENPFIQKKENTGLKLVKSDAKENLNMAINFLSQNNTEEAKKCLDKIKDGDENYEKASMLKVVLSLSSNERENAENVFNKLVSKKITQDENDIDPEDFETILVNARHHFKNNDFNKAKKILKRLTGVDNYNSKYLKFLSVVLIKNGETKEAIETLKKYVTLNPDDGFIRFGLQKLYDGKLEDSLKIIDGKVSEENKKEMAEIVVRTIIEKDIKNLTKEEKFFVFSLALDLEDVELTNAITGYFVDNRDLEIVTHFLTSVSTNHVARQIIFHAVLEKCYTEPVFVLIDGKLTEIKPSYPNVFFVSGEGEDYEKLKYLKAVFAQVYSLLLFAGVSVEKFLNHKDKIFEILYNEKIEDNEVLTNANNLVYALSMVYSNENSRAKESFRYLKDLKREESIEFITNITRDIQ